MKTWRPPVAVGTDTLCSSPSPWHKPRTRGCRHLAAGRLTFDTSDRWLNLPEWLVERLAARAADCGAEGYVFAAPAQRDPERVWDQSNSAGAVRAALDACGPTWAVPHTFRRTVATLLDQANLPIARIADQLGHSDVSMTARVYLGRDLKGDKRDLERVL